jgi:hypothetical protein
MGVFPNENATERPLREFHDRENGLRATRSESKVRENKVTSKRIEPVMSIKLDIPGFFPCSNE